MKKAVRSAAKQAFYGILPVLRTFWFPVKVVEYFVVHPLLSLLPLPLSHKIFRLRWLWRDLGAFGLPCPPNRSV